MIRLVFVCCVCVCVSADLFGKRVYECKILHRRHINRCITEALRDLGKFTITGIPSLGVPVIDPMHLEEVQYGDSSQRGVVVDVNFLTAKVMGMSAMKVRDVRIIPRRKALLIQAEVEVLHIEGNYTLSGHMFDRPIGSRGPFYTEIRNVDASGEADIRMRGKMPISSSSKLYLRNTKVSFDRRDVDIDLEGVVPDDPLIATMVHDFIFDHRERIVQLIEPTVLEKLNGVLENVATDALSELPLEKFAP